MSDGVGDRLIKGLGASHLNPAAVKLPANAGLSKVPVDFALEDVSSKRTLESVLVRKSSTTHPLPILVEPIERRILQIRGQRMMLDRDLAHLYGVTTFNLNKAVKRNRNRFPADFMFQLNKPEAESLRFQIGMSKASGRGGRRYLPYAFTEQGVAMLSSVLRSERAAQVNIAIMRAFVRLRELVSTHKDLARKLGKMEKKHEARFRVVFDAAENVA